MGLNHLHSWQLWNVPARQWAGVGISAILAIALPQAGLAQGLPPTPVDLAAQPGAAATTANLLFVNPSLGNDAGEGSQSAPFRTITRALQFAQPGTVIMLAPGTYSAESGESFPIRLQPGVTLQGDPASHGRGILLRGGGDYLSPTAARQNITLLGGNQAVIAGVTVTNPNARGYGLWIESASPTVLNSTFTGSQHDGISINGASSPLIQGNHFTSNGASGLSVFGTGQPQILNNRFEGTGYGINVADQAAPMIVNNRILNNRNGVVVQEQSRPVLRQNRIEGNAQNGVVAIAQSLPDLGTASNPGNNQFVNNGELDVNATAAETRIPAAGNGLQGDRTSGPVDLAGTTPIPPPVSSAASPPRPAPAATVPPAVTTPPPATVATTAPASFVREAETVNFGQLPPTLAANPESEPETEFPSPNLSALAPGDRITDNQPHFNLFQVESPAAAPAATESPDAESVSIPVPPPVSTRESVLPPSPPVEAADASATPATIPATPASAPREIVVRRSSEPPGEPVPVAVAPAAAAPIEIPVIPAATPAPPPAPPAVNPAPTPNADLLPVPGPDIPIGNVGDMPRVQVSSTPWLQGDPSAPRPSAQELGLRYRVLVEAGGDRTQEQIRALVPGAFRTWFNGNPVMQAGAFGTRANAEAAVQMLNGYGLRAIVAPIE
jgi:parallel beta-helix repeat protein